MAGNVVGFRFDNSIRPVGLLVRHWVFCHGNSMKMCEWIVVVLVKFVGFCSTRACG